MSFHLSAESLDWALSHIQRYGDTDIFPRAFEFDAIGHQWGEMKTFLVGEDLDGWIARPTRVCLTPKGRYAYRVSTQLDPLDSVVYCALLYELGAALEAARVPAADEIVFSHRFDPAADGRLYDPSFTWKRFIDVCGGKATGGTVTHVVLADISDFFHRLYHHRVENALKNATNGSSQARIIFKLLDQWAGTPSYGIPVGPSPSRLVAEVTLDDVDQHLRAEGADFVRFSDDYRIFCTSLKDGYDKPSTLALSLFQNHGLTLQPGKTSIISTEDFVGRSLTSPESEELKNLTSRFDEFIGLIGLTGDPYEQVNYDDLPPEAKAIVDELNLEDLLREQLRSNDPDTGLVRFILRRLAQLNDADVAVELIESAEHYYPVLAHIMEYLAGLRNVPPPICQTVGAAVVGLVDSSIVAHLPYHRCWLLSLFAASRQWGQTGRLAALYNGALDSLTRRKLTLALGRARQSFWFRARRDSARGMDAWERRAFLAGASCLPADEKRYWYRSIRGWLDPLDQATIEWVRDKPL